MNCIYSEHNTQKAVWAFWPSSLCDYHDKGVPAQKSFARFVSAISMHTPVFVAVSEHEYDRARFIIPKHITMYKISYDGVYSDDLNLKWLSEDGEPRVSIGKSISHLARTVLEDLNKNHSISFSENEFPSQLDFETDGAGTFVILESSLNKCGFDSESVADRLKKFGAVNKILIVKDNEFPDIRIDSVRNLLRFVIPGVVIVNNIPNTENNPLYRLFSYVYTLIAGEKNIDGKEFKILTIPFGKYEGVVYHPDSEQYKYSVNSSYLNFLITNQSIVLPLINPEKDNQILIKMHEIMGDFGVDVNGVEACDLLADGLDFHKLTMPVYK